MPNRAALLSSMLAVCLAGVLPAAALSAEPAPVPPAEQYTSYCPGNIGVDYSWPAYSDSPAVNEFRDQIIFALKSLYGFEHDQATFPEVVVPIGNPQRLITLPQGWIIAMDVQPGVYTRAVAIPPMDGPFSDKDGLFAVLTKKNQIFGQGGYLVSPGQNGVHLPCAPTDRTTVMAIVADIPYKGEYVK